MLQSGTINYGMLKIKFRTLNLPKSIRDILIWYGQVLLDRVVY